MPTKYVRGFRSKRTCQSFNFHNLDLWTFIAQKIHGLPMKLNPFRSDQSNHLNGWLALWSSSCSFSIHVAVKQAKIDIDPLSKPVFSLRKVVGRHVNSKAFVICGFEVRKGLKSATGRSLRTLRLRFLRRTRCRRMFSGLCVVGLGGQSASSPALLLA